MSSPSRRGDQPDSRTRILAATLEILNESTDPSMGEVAVRAGLSRQAIYLHFTSRAELLVAVAEWSNEQVGLRERVAWAAQTASAPTMLDRFIEVVVWHVRVIGPALPTLHRAVETDPELAAQWRTRNGRAAQIARIVEALDEQSRLRHDLNQAHAAALLEALTRPVVVTDLLDAGLGEESATALLRRAARAAVCRARALPK